MAIATELLLNSTKGAELIREKTGRSCTRQNLEKLCRQGRLPRSCKSLKPVRVNAQTLVQEYLESVDPRQACRPEPGKKATVLDSAPSAVPVLSTVPEEGLPPYTESQSRKMFEQANLLALERLEREGQLVQRKVVERTWATMVTSVKVKLLAIPSRAKQRIPHLTLDEIDLLTELVRESLEELAEQSGADELEAEED